MKTHLLISFIIISALSITATLGAGSPTSSSADVTLQNSPDEPVKLMGVEFGREQIFVTLQNTAEKDIAELSVSVHFSDSRGPYMWTGRPEGLLIHNLGAHSVVKVGLSKPDMSDEKEDFDKLLRMKKKYVVAGLLVSKLVFKDSSTGDRTQ